MKRLTAWMLIASLALELAIPPGLTVAASAAPGNAGQDGRAGMGPRTVSQKVGELVPTVTTNVYETPASRQEADGKTVTKSVYALQL